MKNLKMTVKILIAFAILIPAIVRAQPGIPPPTSNILWQCDEQRVPFLSTAPPYSGYMSLDAFVGYYWFDSLMRSLTSRSQVDSLKRQLNSFDTIKHFL